MAWTYSVTETQFPSAVTDHDANLPATVNAGDALILLWSHPDTTVDVSAGPSGWTLKSGPDEQPLDAGGGAHQSIYGLDAAGTEGGGTARITTGSAVTGAAIVIRITAASWSGDLAEIEFGTIAKTVSANPDPPSVTASWGAEDNLFIEFVSAANDDATVSSFSTSYVDGVDTVSGGGVNDGATSAVAFRELTAATDDPGTLTLSESENWVAQTCVVRPAAAVAGGRKGPLGWPLHGPLGGPLGA